MPRLSGGAGAWLALAHKTDLAELAATLWQSLRY